MRACTLLSSSINWNSVASTSQIDLSPQKLAGNKERQNISENSAALQMQIPQSPSPTSLKPMTGLVKTETDEEDENEGSREGEGEDVTDMVCHLLWSMSLWLEFFSTVAVLVDGGTPEFNRAWVPGLCSCHALDLQA